MRAASMRVFAIATLVFVSSCDRGVTAPAPSGNSAERLLLSSPTAVTVVQRNTALPAPLTASAVVGIFGGQLSIPGAGLRVTVPPFAVTSSTRITVTALPGNQVAYEFEPHGLRFLTPLLVSQSLVGTSASSGGLLGRPVVAGYFASVSDLDPLSNTGLVSELLGVALNLSTKTATFPVFHFSGYLVATGRDSRTFEELDSQ